MNEAPKKIYWSPDERLADENNDNSNEIPYIRADLVRDDIPDGSFVYLHPAPKVTQDENPVAFISKNGFRFNADIEPIEHGIEVPLYLHPDPHSYIRKDVVNQLIKALIAIGAGQGDPKAVAIQALENYMEEK